MLTELAKTEIDYKEMSTEEVAAKVKMWGDKSQLLMAEARKAASEADYNEKTMDDRVAKAGYETVNSMLENIQKMRNIEFTEANNLQKKLDETDTDFQQRKLAKQVEAAEASKKVTEDEQAAKEKITDTQTVS